MSNKKNSSIPKQDPNFKNTTSLDKEIVPVFLTNTVTDATFRGEGNAPIPSEYAVLEAKSFSGENRPS